MFRWLLQPDRSLMKYSVGQLFVTEPGPCSTERSAVVGVLWLPLHTKNNLTDMVLPLSIALYLIEQVLCTDSPNKSLMNGFESHSLSVIFSRHVGTLRSFLATNTSHSTRARLTLHMLV